ncbi:MAG: cold shock domain-containing protein, partial [Bacteroidetes bacterium]|nr:cold shock domain-containing protein [Bacteroidota bacterium]
MILQKIKAWLQGKKAPKPESDKIKTGVLLFFNRKKGYGFISSKQALKDIYVHIKDTKDRIRKGDRVRFEVERSDKG